jgi:hypothetical protein
MASNRANWLGVDWLAANDPTYVKPAMKAAQTRKVAFSREAIEAMSGSAVRKVGGRYVQCSPLAFVGGTGEGDSERTVAVTPGQVIRGWTEQPIRRRGKRGGRNH